MTSIRREEGDWATWLDIDTASWAPSDDADFSLANYPESKAGARAAFEIPNGWRSFVWTAEFLDSSGEPAIPGTNDQTFNLQLFERTGPKVLAAGEVLEVGAVARTVYGPYEVGRGRYVPRVTAVAGTDPALPTLRIKIREA
jgi:hypothetical protein